MNEIMSGIIGALFGMMMAVWVYKVVNRHDGQRPWLWAVGAFTFFPLVATIAGFKYNETVMLGVGITGLCLVAAFIGLVVIS